MKLRTVIPGDLTTGARMTGATAGTPAVVRMDSATAFDRAFHGRRTDRGTQIHASASAFTFIEVLFAIIILGVGMIMIAGMLPVAIKQNADTRNELTAKVVCDDGYAYLRTLAATHPEAFPETMGLQTYQPPLSPGDPGKVNVPGPIKTPSPTSPFAKFLGADLMLLQSNDSYTAPGGSPFPDSSTYNASSPSTKPPTDRRAGRVVPLTFDIVYPANATPGPGGGYDIGNLLDNHAKNVKGAGLMGYVTQSPEINDYPLAYHQMNFGDRIINSEPRFQWMGFYRRDEGATSAKLTIIAMRQQNADVVDRFRAADDSTTNQNGTMPHEQINALNGPFLVPVEIEDCLTEPDKVKFTFSGANPTDVDVAETGAYLIIAHSPPLSGSQKAGDLNRPFRNNGRVFKLAAHRDDLEPTDKSYRVWELAPGYDLGPAGAGPDGILGTADDVPDGSMNTTQSFADNSTRSAAVTQYPVSDPNGAAPVYVKGTTAWAWIIGRGRTDPTSPAAGPHSGPTQDLGVLSVEIPLK